MGAVDVMSDARLPIPESRGRSGRRAANVLEHEMRRGEDKGQQRGMRRCLIPTNKSHKRGDSRVAREAVPVVVQGKSALMAAPLQPRRGSLPPRCLRNCFERPA